jgi:hypothetical protein
MPTSGLSLVGFMDQTQALNHLKTGCVPGAKTDAQLILDWQAAVANLGATIPNGGNPNIQSIPTAYQSYLQQVSQALSQHPSFGQIISQGATFQLVEIDPLLAFQFHVDTDRSAQHCNALSKPPTTDELMTLALPINPSTDSMFFNIQARSAVITSRSSNLRLFAGGANMNTGLAISWSGIQFGFVPPMVFITRYNRRCYLSNGFHRAYGARLAGATHIPCLFHDVADYHAVGIQDGGMTFTLQLLESGNPPTVCHFTQARAHNVELRKTRRVLYVSWDEHVVADE